MIIFVDIDGVLHPRVGSAGFLESCMDSLKLAFQPFQVEIVVSSTWKLTCHRSELEELLSPLAKPKVGITPEIERGTDYKRQREIVAYANLNNVTRWVAIDDSSISFFPDQSNVYFTNPLTGFVVDDILPLQKMIKSEIIQKRI